LWLPAHWSRFGTSLAQEQGIPYIALELDSKIVSSAWEAGESVYYADATRPEILVAAGVYRARMVVITVADAETAKLITEAARKKQKDVPILVRVRDDQSMQALMNIGATEVLPESLAASVMVARRVLENLDLPSTEITEVVDRIRAEGYRALKTFFHGEQLKTTTPKQTTETFLHTAVLQANDRAVGMSIADLQLDSLGVALKSLRRGDIRGDYPDTDMVLRADDKLVLERSTDGFQDVEKRLRGENRERDKDRDKDKDHEQDKARKARATA